ncbi:hypothetical protein PR001_g24865 [Phytophthora rubi]|nr:hypothetical protein PR001_g24865 [Phytophthora rubi]
MARVVSCRFMRLGCFEEDHPLFRREYARNNRERGVKLLRCFPHCCPEHVKRSYCGCSVHVLVTFSADVSEMPLDELRVCARFEPTRVAPLWPAGFADIARNLGAAAAADDRQENKCRLEVGESVVLPDAFPTATGQSTDNGGVWVLAEKESDANHRGLPKNVALYVLNSGISPKWFYNYDSSVTRAQREMTHHLVAYVFQAHSGSVPRPLQQQQELQRHHERSDGVVVARHASPAFFLISYRRSGAASNPGCALPALPVDESSDNEEAAASEIRSASRIVQQQAQQQHRLQLHLRQHHRQQQQLIWQQQQRQQQLHVDQAQGHPFHSAPPRETLSSDFQGATGDEKVAVVQSNTSADDVGDDDSWLMDVGARTQGFCEKAQHLLILWRVIQRISLRDLEHNINMVDVHVRSHWLRAAEAPRAPLVSFDTQLEGVAASFLGTVFESVSGRENQPNNSGCNPFTVREQRTIRVSVHLFLRALSSRAVQHLLCSACRMGNGDATKQDLLNRFVSLVLRLYELLGDVLRDVTSTEDTALRDSLPALVDDVLSLVQQNPRPELHHDITNLRDIHNIFPRTLIRLRICGIGDGCWSLEPYRLSMLTTDGGTCMTVQSVLTFSGGASMAPMELVLDGQFREFSVLPSGLSSKIATAEGWYLGDYVAVLSDDGQAVEMRFFAFAEDTSVASADDARGGVIIARQVIVSIALEQEPSTGEAIDHVVHPRDLFVIVHGTV